MIAAVLAMLASRQVAAVTLAVRHGLATGRPVAGSSRWCADPPSVSHRRTVVLEVARPPVRSVIHCPGAVASERWSSVTRIRQPSSGGCPAIEMSPPSETSTPHSALALPAAAAWSAASALAVAPRSSTTPRAVQTVPAARSTCTVCQPGTDAILTVAAPPCPIASKSRS